MLRSKAQWAWAVILLGAFAAVAAGYAYTKYLEQDHYVAGLGRIDSYSVGQQSTQLTIYYSVGAWDLAGDATVREDTRAVTVRVNTSVFMPGTGRFKNAAAYGMDTTVTLKEPLGERVVIDGGTGKTVAPIPHP